ncbi:MAG: hypothetical protein AAF170_14430 [Bacteroidota bacterium]
MSSNATTPRFRLCGNRSNAGRPWRLQLARILSGLSANQNVMEQTDAGMLAASSW